MPLVRLAVVKIAPWSDRTVGSIDVFTDGSDRGTARDIGAPDHRLLDRAVQLHHNLNPNESLLPRRASRTARWSCARRGLDRFDRLEAAVIMRRG